MKTAELSGAQLDYWVAKALGWRLDASHTLHDRRAHGMNVVVTPAVGFEDNGDDFEPSDNWAHGGPIIERERISVTWPEAEPQSGYEWHANIARPEASWNCYGPTSLIAAMRAFVASKFGEEVPEIPTP